MRPAFFWLIVVAAHVCVVVDCRPQRQHQHQAGLSAASGRFHAEFNRWVRKGVLRGLQVIVPVRTANGGFVLVFDWRRKRFLCMDFKGKLYKSKQKDRPDGLSRSDEADHHDTSWLLRLEGRDLLVVHQEPPEVSAALLESFLEPLVKRRRRSQEVNPSDPLRSEPNPPPSVKDAGRGPSEQEQTGSVSKETITSVDDPLWVLRPNGHGSPVKTNIAERAEHK